MFAAFIHIMYPVILNGGGGGSRTPVHSTLDWSHSQAYLIFLNKKNSVLNPAKSCNALDFHPVGNHLKHDSDGTLLITFSSRLSDYLHLDRWYEETTRLSS